MLGYLSGDIIYYEKQTVFRERSSRKTVSFEEQIMSKDEYPSTFSKSNGGSIVSACERRRISGCHLVPPKNNVCEPESENDFCDVGILSQSQFSSNNPETTARGIRCEERSSFIPSWNLIGQRETKVITSQKSFPGLGSQTSFFGGTKWQPEIRLRSQATIVFIILQIFLATRTVSKIGEYSGIFPSCSCGMFGHVTRFDQSRASENIWWIIKPDNKHVLRIARAIIHVDTHERVR